MADDEHVAGAQSIGRAVALLRILAAGQRDGVSLSEIVERSGLMKPTCRRILLALMDAGLAEQDVANRRYFLGPETYALGAIASERFGVHRLAQEGVARLAQQTGDAAFLQIRRGWSVLCLHREDGPYPIRSHVLAAGDRHPLGVGAGGLAVMAALPESDAKAALAANRGQLEARYPTMSQALIQRLVAETRERGYSMNRGLLFPGSWGMGMAVRDHRGRAEACLSIASIESRMQPDREPQLARWLAEEVRLLEDRLRDFGALTENRDDTQASPALKLVAGRRH